MEPSDNELLAKYVRCQDESAILEIVHRYSPMVMGVCQSLLWHQEDSEDAFQATFLVLAHKAHRLQTHSSIAGWLHQVAVRNCQNLRRQKQRKREVELSQEPALNSDEPWKSISDQHDREQVQLELTRLPKRYRQVLILCHIEGRSRSEAANLLNCTTASVKALLARGRQLLRRRLIRHGIVASAVISVLAASTEHARAQLAPELINHLAKSFSHPSLRPGPGSSPESVQQLVQQELTSMNLSILSKIGVYSAFTISMISVPLFLMAQTSGPRQSHANLLPASEFGEFANTVEFENIATQEDQDAHQIEILGTPPADGLLETTNSLDAQLLEASKDSPEYWLLIKDAAKARAKDLTDRIAMSESGIQDSLGVHELRARLLEEQAKVLQVDLLLKTLNQPKPTAQSFVPPASDAVLRPGEVITIEYPNHLDFNRTVVVAADLTISLPLLGVVNTENTSPIELRKRLKEQYAKYIQNPMIDLYRGDMPQRTGNEIPLSSTEPVQAGEVLTLESLSMELFNRRVTIQEDLTVTVPVIGTIKADNLTPAQLSKKVEIAAKRFFRDPQVQVSRGCLTEPRGKDK